jgi:hypothetical protein
VQHVQYGEEGSHTSNYQHAHWQSTWYVNSQGFLCSDFIYLFIYSYFRVLIYFCCFFFHIFVPSYLLCFHSFAFCCQCSFHFIHSLIFGFFSHSSYTNVVESAEKYKKVIVTLAYLLRYFPVLFLKFELTFTFFLHFYCRFFLSIFFFRVLHYFVCGILDYSIVWC